MENLPAYVYLTFGLTVILAVWLFLKATHYSKSFLLTISIWMLLQSILGVAGFYSHVETMTFRFPLLVIPPVIALIFRFITRSGKAFIDNLDLKTLTIFHIVRIPVELVLFWLFLHQTVPQAVTFEGRNFDILSGVSAPFIYYFGFVKNKLNDRILIIWNCACLALLLFVVANAILSLPGRFEQFGFEQPNIALGYFPFTLLPAVVVPLAMFANFAAIRQLIKKVSFKSEINLESN